LAEAPLRALIVDDEPLARRGLRLHLQEIGGVEVVGESTGGRQAIADIRSLQPQAVFLDVQMPAVDGFGVVDAIGAWRMPATVFVTAHEEHALRAFEAHAVNYILKPVDPARLRDAVKRLRAIVRSGKPEEKLVLRDGARVLVLDPGGISWIGAEGDYLRIHEGRGSHLVRHTMAGIEEKLDPSRFARIHRSTIVNVERVREIRPDGDRLYRVVLRDGTLLKTSRGHRDRVVALLQSLAG
jgi:two-component system LytT family response regulator